MRNGEIDYDQIFTASIDLADSIWLPPPSAALAEDVADGFDARYLLSTGGFSIGTR